MTDFWLFTCLLGSCSSFLKHLFCFSVKVGVVLSETVRLALGSQTEEIVWICQSNFCALVCVCSSFPWNQAAQRQSLESKQMFVLPSGVSWLTQHFFLQTDMNIRQIDYADKVMWPRARSSQWCPELGPQPTTKAFLALLTLQPWQSYFGRKQDHSCSSANPAKVSPA